jgi:hypothetical protein
MVKKQKKANDINIIKNIYAPIRRAKRVTYKKDDVAEESPIRLRWVDPNTKTKVTYYPMYEDLLLYEDLEGKKLEGGRTNFSYVTGTDSEFGHTFSSLKDFINSVVRNVSVQDDWTSVVWKVNEGTLFVNNRVWKNRTKMDQQYAREFYRLIVIIAPLW